MTSTSAIVAKLWSQCLVLRNEFFTYHDPMPENESAKEAKKTGDTSSFEYHE